MLPVRIVPAARVPPQLIEIMGADALAADAQAQLFQVDEANVALPISLWHCRAATDEDMLAVEAAVLP